MLAVLVAGLTGCSDQDKSYNYNFKSTKWDSYEMGKLSVDSSPPRARVYVKVRCSGYGDMHTPQGDATHTMTDQEIQHDMKDWTLIGTTPINEFPLLLSGKSSDRHLTSSATFVVKMEECSLRIEKEGYNTLELSKLAFPNGALRLNLDLVPSPSTTKPAGGATTAPAAAP